ncbi:hypothetical protein CGZ93_16185 [Enemella dayhoffiae]|uniref:Uncharacterized protein n=1 Tax=Enemella dayhoffiae TaxID=2016507 RepID=A0A255GU33_9ACTN|nr:hypothetical protein [Enemella dayhoffiae]OYO18093.1 hypothetical protein CGZ93_16185 [Enemella dayhoffiae]
MLNQAERRRQVLLAWAFVMRERGEQVPGNEQLTVIAMTRAVPPGLRTPLVNRWAQVLHHLMWLSDQGHPDPVADAMNRLQAGPRPPFPQGGGVRPGMPPGQRPGPPGPPQPPQPSQPARPVAPSFPPPPPGMRPGQPLPSATEPEPTDEVVDADIVDAELVEDTPAVPPPADSPAEEPAASTESEPELPPLQRLMVWRDQQGQHELKDRHLRQVVNSGAQTVPEVAAGLPASLKPMAAQIAAVLGLGGRPPADARPAESTPPTARVEDEPASPAPGRTEAEPAAPGQLNPDAVTWQQPLELSEVLGEFSAMDFSEPSGEPVAVKASARADGSTMLRWPAYQAEVGEAVVYRVVADDEHVPYSPDMSEVIAVTQRTQLIDDRPFASAVRHYQVWVNTGANAGEAALNQPRMHARLPMVAKPADVDIREDEGRVIGQWAPLAGVRRVQVYRVPAERAAAGAGNPMYRICHDEANLGGFVDHGAEPGRRYLYQLMVEAEVEGVPQLSLPTVVPVTISVVLQPVQDLQCRLEDEGGAPQFDLRWTDPPAGRVVIYRTTGGPLPGADADTVDEQALPQMRLRAEDRLAHPMATHDGVTTMEDVPWPRGWSRTYFTPVTLIDGKARVGVTTSQVRTGEVEDATVVERVSGQVLTMDWPEGAASIKVYASPAGQPAADALPGAEPIAEISQETYVRLGGLHFSRPLDSGGCDLHLVPVSFAGGRAIEGRPTTVSYRGLLKLWYEVDRRPGIPGRQPSLLLVRIRADRPNHSAPPFALVFNPYRLPLDVNDGEAINVRPATEQPSQWSARFRPPGLQPQWSAPGWMADVTGRVGWIRVFVDLAPDPRRGTVALLDPAVQRLYLDGR